MATLSKHLFSGSNGKVIKVAAKTASGTTIHQVASSATDFDEAWLAVNASSSAAKLTIEWGETTSPVAGEDGLFLAIPAFAAIANAINFVNRITA